MRKLINLIFLLTLTMVTYFASAQSRDIPNRIVEADLSNQRGRLNTSYKTCIGAGRANEGLRADWQRQLRIAKQQCGFEYIRFHGLLSDDMGVYKEDKNGKPIYNWQYIDELYDFLLSIQIKPFVELGFMPAALASKNKTVFWWKGNVSPPNDYVKWNDLIRKLVQHWTERYGRTEVATWYFEVWNEPNLQNLFFTGDQGDYFKLYQETAQTIKTVDPVYRVGGPATAGNAWIPDLINFCVDKHVPIDFISTHDYGVKKGFLDLTGNIGTIVFPDKNAVSNDMLRSKTQILHSHRPDLQLHYTEWSSSYTPTDPIHDTYEEASFILNTVKRASSHVNSMSYWTFTDIFEEQGPRMTPFHGGFGLMNYQDIKKSAYYTFKFLNELGKYDVTCADSSSFITKNGNGDVSALIWDCTIDHPADSTNDQIFYAKKQPARNLGSLEIKLKGLKAGKYRLNIYKIGYGVNDPYTTYLELGSPSQLTRDQVKLIKSQNGGSPILSAQVSINNLGTFKRTLPIRENDVYFIRLIKSVK